MGWIQGVILTWNQAKFGLRRMVNYTWRLYYNFYQLLVRFWPPQRISNVAFSSS